MLEYILRNRLLRVILRKQCDRRIWAGSWGKRTVPLILVLLMTSAVDSSDVPWNPARTVYGRPPWAVNPALLAVNYGEAWGYELIGITTSMANNSIDLDLYTKYNGTFLDHEDKQTILAEIADELRGRAVTRVGAMSLRAGKLGYIMRSYVGSDVGLDKDLLEIAFFGNTLGEQYHLLNSGHLLAMSSFGFSYGHPLGSIGAWKFAAGGGLEFLFPWKAAAITESRGELITEDTGVTGWGATAVRYSQGTGKGIAFDLGFWAAFDQLEIRLAVSTIGPSIIWPESTEEYYHFEMDGWTLEKGDDAFAKADSTRNFSSWSTPLPTELRSLVAVHTAWGQIHLAWIQGLRTLAGVSTEPRFLLGTEWEPLSWLRPRFGISIGGLEDLSLSIGSRLNLWVLHTDLSVFGFRLPAGRSKAFGLSLSIGLGDI